ncbi:MAG: methylcobamide:CoM methyltransferase MtaA [Candidatus Methanoglobus sp.]
MNSRDRVIGAIKLEKVDRKPVTSVTQVGVVEAMEKVDAYWPEAHSNPEKMARLGASLYKLVGLEAVRIPFCLTVEAEVLGCKIKMGGLDTQPSVSESPKKIPDEIPANLLELGRIPVVINATKMLCNSYPEVPKVIGITGPMTLAGHILGVENLLKYIIKSPDTVKKALDFCVEVSKRYIDAIIEVGPPDIICVPDPTASPEITPPPTFNSLVAPALREISKMINKECISVLHICGRVQKILGTMADTGFHGLSIEEKVDVKEARGIVKSKVALIGNISAPNTLLRGPPEKITEEVRAILDYIDLVAPGCGLAPRTPLSNIKALVDSVKIN